MKIDVPTSPRGVGKKKHKVAQRLRHLGRKTKDQKAPTTVKTIIGKKIERLAKLATFKTFLDVNPAPHIVFKFG